jgi:hypothetical protein
MLGVRLRNATTVGEFKFFLPPLTSHAVQRSSLENVSEQRSANVSRRSFGCIGRIYLDGFTKSTRLNMILPSLLSYWFQADLAEINLENITEKLGKAN